MPKRKGKSYSTRQAVQKAATSGKQPRTDWGKSGEPWGSMMPPRRRQPQPGVAGYGTYKAKKAGGSSKSHKR